MKNRKKPKAPQKNKVIEVTAYVQLESSTLESCRLLKQNVDCVRYRIRSIEAAFNNGHRLYVYDHRKEAVSATRQYKNHKRLPFFGNRMSPAKVIIMKKDPGGYYINIFSPDHKAQITATLKEEIVKNPFGGGFSITGEPSWWLVGYMDQSEISYIALNDFMNADKSLTIETKTDLNNAV